MDAATTAQTSVNATFLIMKFPRSRRFFLRQRTKLADQWQTKILPRSINFPHARGIDRREDYSGICRRNGRGNRPSSISAARTGRLQAEI
jgi:hypothetical protein